GHGRGSAGHVLAVIAVADRPVEVDQRDAFGRDGGAGPLHPVQCPGVAEGLRCHASFSLWFPRFRGGQSPRRSATVPTGASHSSVSVSSSRSTVIEAPCISSEVM